MRAGRGYCLGRRQAAPTTSWMCSERVGAGRWSLAAVRAAGRECCLRGREAALEASRSSSAGHQCRLRWPEAALRTSRMWSERAAPVLLSAAGRVAGRECCLRSPETALGASWMCSGCAASMLVSVARRMAGPQGCLRGRKAALTASWVLLRAPHRVLARRAGGGAVAVERGTGGRLGRAPGVAGVRFGGC